MQARPTKAKKEMSQSSVVDFFGKGAGTAKKTPNPRRVLGSKSKAVSSDDEVEDEGEDSDIPPPPPRRPTARATAAAKKYVEIPSDDEEVEDDSMYQDD